MREINFYIHNPFCKIKCFYCGFYSLCGQDKIWKQYFSQLKQEILSFKNKFKNYQIKTIYFGGGTPNLVEAEYLKEVIDLIKINFKTKLKEITVECNPEFITEEKLKIYKDAGVNRVSIGVQSFDEKILNLTGRRWNLDKREIEYFDFIKEKVGMVKHGGFDNFGLDLIFGIPEQTLASWQDSIEKAISLEPKHISAYSLEIDNNSVLGKSINCGKVKEISENLDRKMYHLAGKILKENGYDHYEISNWAQKGFECQHNLDFWQGKDYIGFGAGASSYWRGKYYENDKLDKYLERNKFDKKIAILKSEELEVSYLMKRLRLIKEGINIKEWENVFKNQMKKDYLEKFKILEIDDLVKINRVKIVLTRKGINLENKIVEFLV